MAGPKNMVNHHDTLARAAQWLKTRLSGCQVNRVYAGSDKELLFIFNKGHESFALKAYVGEESFIFFPPIPEQISRHNGPFGDQLNGKPLIDIYVNPSDRSLTLSFEGSKNIVIALYGRNGNVIYFEGNEPKQVFRKTFKKIAEKQLSEYTETEGTGLSADDEAPQSPHFYIYKQEKGNREDVLMSFTPVAEAELLLKTTNIEEALNTYARHYFKLGQFWDRKEKSLKAAVAKVSKLKQKIKSLEEHLEHLEKERNYRHRADIIMANLHQIPPGAQEVELLDFYTGKQVKIELKRDMSPQRFAEKLYTRSKNQVIEKQKTEENLEKVLEELEKAQRELAEIGAAGSVKELRGLKQQEEKQSKTEAPPFRHFKVQGFDIYAGKGAGNNDKLSFGFAKKDDLWLHAREVSGSHVIVRGRKNIEFPASLIEKAASIAAYYSKARGSGLVPVLYTLKKYVRKPKGATPGKVICEREKVVMVEPGLP